MDPTLLRPLPKAPAFRSVLVEALKCMKLAFRDSLQPKVIFHSLAIWLVSLTFWGLLFYWQWDKISQTAMVAAALVMLAIHSLFPHPSDSSEVATTTGTVSIVMMFLSKVMIGMDTVMSAMPGFIVLTYALVALPFVLLVLISVRILQEVFLMKYVQKRTLTRYPQLEKGAQSKWLDGLRLSAGSNVKAWLITLFCLFIPVVNGVVILLSGCYFNAKSLVGDALEDLATAQEVKQFTRENRLGILMLGVLHLGVLLIPFVGLLAPAIMGSSMCHFCFRAKARQLAQPTG